MKFNISPVFPGKLNHPNRCYFNLKTLHEILSKTDTKKYLKAKNKYNIENFTKIIPFGVSTIYVRYIKGV